MAHELPGKGRNLSRRKGVARRLGELPYTEIGRMLAGSKPMVAILPVGATEAHGPHLPLSTDVIISEAFAAKAAELIESEGLANAVLLPPLAYSPADYASGFPGTVSLRWETMAALLRDIGLSLKSQGFGCLAIANSHFDPANVNVLRNAAKDISSLGLPVAFADATRRGIAAQLTAEFQSGDCHGGQFEGSIVLASRPELVDQTAMRVLPPVSAGLIGAMKSGAPNVRFETAGMPGAYCGNPSGATPDEGRESIGILGRALADAVRQVLTPNAATGKPAMTANG